MRCYTAKKIAKKLFQTSLDTYEEFVHKKYTRAKKKEEKRWENEKSPQTFKTYIRF